MLLQYYKYLNFIVIYDLIKITPLLRWLTFN